MRGMSMGAAAERMGDMDGENVMVRLAVTSVTA